VLFRAFLVVEAAPMRPDPKRDLDGTLLSPGRPALAPGWTSEGVIEVLEPLSEPRRRERILGVAEARVGSVTLLMDAPYDPHNAAAVIRSCDAFGVPELHVVPRDGQFLIGKRVTQGTERWVDVMLHERPESAVHVLRSRGFRLIATHPNGNLTPEELAPLPRVCLVLGNEHDGISAALTGAADDTVRIPMRGFVESLNLSVAAALLLRAATLGRNGDLSSGERRRLYATGLARSVPRAEEILAAMQPR
jgi:tRNA (guanosine-2'-O-)-methyltransferase